jgi:tetratricopeptide (TPR) repeat protein
VKEIPPTVICSVSVSCAASPAVRRPVSLGERLELLTGGAVDQPERQQTLRGTLEWSYDHLTTGEQQLFARLAVFAGGWSVDAANAVCAGEGDVVERLSSLVDKSLVQAEAVDGDPRHTLLETLREYAGELLAGSAEHADVQLRHAGHFLALAEEAEAFLRGTPGPWLDRLELEHDNLRTALDRLHASGEPELCQRLAGALWRFWYLRGYLSEGQRRLEQALALDERPTAARAKILLGAAVMAANRDDEELAASRAEEALALHRAGGDRWGAAYARFMLGNVAPDRERARRLYEESVLTFRELGDEHSALLASRHLAWTLAALGRQGDARELHTESLERARATRNVRMEASALGSLAEHALDDGRVDEALSLLRDALRLHREVGDVLDTAVDLCRLAAALATRGDAATAAMLVAVFDALGDHVGRRQAWVAELNEQTLADARGRLDQAAFTQAWSTGQALSVEDALELALNVA